MIEFHGKNKLDTLLFKGCSILELGNQIMNLSDCQGMTAKDYYTDKGYKHTSIDINGKDGVLKLNLCEPIDLKEQFDVVTDFGTIEHTKSLYQVLKNVYNHCKEGGFMLHKNPKTGSFPLHGNHFFTTDFWNKYAKELEMDCEVYEHAIYHNTIDGWEIVAVLKKGTKNFMSETKFKTLLKYVYNK